jgi:hypothetical protein
MKLFAPDGDVVIGVVGFENSSCYCSIPTIASKFKLSVGETLGRKNVRRAWICA